MVSMRREKRAREFYSVARDLFDRELYRSAFVLAYYGLFSVGRHGEFRDVWEAFLKGVEINASEVERALSVLASALGEGSGVVVEIGLTDFLALGVIGVSLGLVVFQAGPPWLDAVLIPLATLTGLLYILHIIRKRRK